MCDTKVDILSQNEIDTNKLNILFEDDGKFKYDSIVYGALKEVNFFQEEDDFKHSLLLYLSKVINKFDESKSALETFIANYSKYFVKRYMTKENLYENRFNDQSIDFEDILLFKEDTSYNNIENEFEYKCLTDFIKKQLTPKEWFVIRCSMDGYSQEEMAKYSNVSQQSISRILVKAREKIKDILEYWHSK